MHIALDFYYIVDSIFMRRTSARRKNCEPDLLNFMLL